MAKLKKRSWAEPFKIKVVEPIKKTTKEFREKAKETYRERYQIDPDYREKTLKRANDRYHTDESYRQATIDRAKERNKKKNNVLRKKK